jgi:hypothetical protein
MRKMGLLIGLGAGYVLGSRAGRERYEQIVDAYNNFMGNPKVQDTMSTMQSQAESLAGQAKEQASHLAGSAKEKMGSGDDSGSGSDSAYDVVEMPDSMAQAGSNGRMGG